MLGRIKMESFTTIEGGRTTLDLSYLEETNFHIERIIDYITPSIPLFSIHQARTVLLFFYAISIAVIYCFVPQFIKGSTVITEFVICFPIICVTALHIILSFGYILFALFAGASFKTLLGILFYLHTSYPIAIFTILMLQFSRDIKNLLFLFLIAASISTCLDLILGFISASYFRTFLLFEGVLLLPSFVIWTLFIKGIIPSKFYIFAPSILFYFLYFNFLIGLAKCSPKFFNKISIKFFNDATLYAEYEAADDYQSYWNSALWRDDTLRVHEKESSSSSTSSQSSVNQKGEPKILLSSKKKDFRFPRKERFQLYKLDEIPQHPFYICSLIPFVLLAGITATVAIHCFSEIPGFLIVFAAEILCLVMAIVFNSRAISWNCFTITNIGRDTINILWDHPSLSTL
ncbi:hypothetical protein TRFO_32586 [Tritrichomonas foetus]|uniref:Uncharacterized protein n=1 Tax=Tritrichomonas foetus TaxID=1144522 RepID=A0A1J4JNH4_9EUKA|nr:hypothetical protein TRFO_32586 [Tritrichomonas foetus]|eukprot:OHT00673.1 hypothetical protein TRFO_32586 [Tritrichomonas foetus]